MDFRSIKQAILDWCKADPSIRGLAVVGSYARNAQTADSDVDICLFVEAPALFIDNHLWAYRFGNIQSKRIENWGAVKTVRVFYQQGMEVEFNFCTLSWADIPVDPGTQRVATDGMEVLYDPSGMLSKLQMYLN